MAVVYSDSFAGLNVSASPNGRTLNNALGGTASAAWITNAAIGDSVSGAVDPEGGYMIHQATADGIVKCELRAIDNGSNFILWANGSATSTFDNTYVGLWIGLTSMRIRQLDAGGASLGDVATTTITTIATGSSYFIQTEYGNGTVKCRMFGSDGTTLRGPELIVSATPSGNRAGFAEYFGTGTAYDFVDNWTFSSASATGGGGGGARRKTYVYNPLGNLTVDFRRIG